MKELMSFVRSKAGDTSDDLTDAKITAALKSAVK